MFRPHAREAVLVLSAVLGALSSDALAQVKPLRLTVPIYKTKDKASGPVFTPFKSKKESFSVTIRLYDGVDGPLSYGQTLVVHAGSAGQSSTPEVGEVFLPGPVAGTVDLYVGGDEANPLPASLLGGDPWFSTQVALVKDGDSPIEFLETARQPLGLPVGMKSVTHTLTIPGVALQKRLDDQGEPLGVASTTDEQLGGWNVLDVPDDGDLTQSDIIGAAPVHFPDGAVITGMHAIVENVVGAAGIADGGIVRLRKRELGVTTTTDVATLQTSGIVAGFEEATVSGLGHVVDASAAVYWVEAFKIQTASGDQVLLWSLEITYTVDELGL